MNNPHPLLQHRSQLQPQPPIGSAPHHQYITINQDTTMSRGNASNPSSPLLVQASGTFQPQQQAQPHAQQVSLQPRGAGSPLLSQSEGFQFQHVLRQQSDGGGGAAQKHLAYAQPLQPPTAYLPLPQPPTMPQAQLRQPQPAQPPTSTRTIYSPPKSQPQSQSQPQAQPLTQPPPQQQPQIPPNPAQRPVTTATNTLSHPAPVLAAQSQPQAQAPAQSSQTETQQRLIAVPSIQEMEGKFRPLMETAWNEYAAQVSQLRTKLFHAQTNLAAQTTQIAEHDRAAKMRKAEEERLRAEMEQLKGEVMILRRQVGDLEGASREALASPPELEALRKQKTADDELIARLRTDFESITKPAVFPPQYDDLDADKLKELLRRFIAGFNGAITLKNGMEKARDKAVEEVEGVRGEREGLQKEVERLRAMVEERERLEREVEASGATGVDLIQKTREALKQAEQGRVEAQMQLQTANGSLELAVKQRLEVEKERDGLQMALALEKPKTEAAGREKAAASGSIGGDPLQATREALRTAEQERLEAQKKLQILTENVGRLMKQKLEVEKERDGLKSALNKFKSELGDKEAASAAREAAREGQEKQREKEAEEKRKQLAGLAAQVARESKVTDEMEATWGEVQKRWAEEKRRLEGEKRGLEEKLEKAKSAAKATTRSGVPAQTASGPTAPKSVQLRELELQLKDVQKDLDNVRREKALLREEQQRLAAALKTAEAELGRLRKQRSGSGSVRGMSQRIEGREEIKWLGENATPVRAPSGVKATITTTSATSTPASLPALQIPPPAAALPTLTPTTQGTLTAISTAGPDNGSTAPPASPLRASAGPTSAVSLTSASPATDDAGLGASGLKRKRENSVDEVKPGSAPPSSDKEYWLEWVRDNKSRFITTSNECQFCNKIADKKVAKAPTGTPRPAVYTNSNEDTIVQHIVSKHLPKLELIHQRLPGDRKKQKA